MDGCDDFNGNCGLSCGIKGLKSNLQQPTTDMRRRELRYPTNVTEPSQQKMSSHFLHCALESLCEKWGRMSCAGTRCRARWMIYPDGHEPRNLKTQQTLKGIRMNKNAKYRNWNGSQNPRVIARKQIKQSTAN